MKIIFEESKKGKPVLGICNGAQILIETKMVPGIHNKLEMALAPNINPFMQGFRSKWVELSMNTSKKTAFNRSFEKGEKIRMPIAHAEGRFITKDNGLLETIRKEGLIVFKYSSSSPNSSVEDAAAICNLEGNVMSMMPHPECGSFFRQEPEFSGKLEENEKTSATNKIFQSMRSYIEENKEKWQK